MILIDSASNIALLDGVEGINTIKAWTNSMFITGLNTSNSFLVDLPTPEHFVGGKFKLENDQLVPIEEYVPVLADIQAGLARADAKVTREETVGRIQVTTSSGKAFDGDETSQNRMARAIIALQATGTPSVTWVLADNTPVSVSAEELVEALALAGAAQANVWVI